MYLSADAFWKIFERTGSVSVYVYYKNLLLQ
jgi:hypothetical protein